MLTDADIDVATELAKENMQPERLEKLRRGYLAVHYPKWVTAVFEKELEAAHSDTLNAGGGRELTAITDDRFLGVVLKTLLDRLKGEIFNSDDSLANAIREVLDTVSEGQTLFGRIKQGGLGVQAYQRARFLKIGSDAFVISWARMFIKEYYPATLSKRGSRYSIVHDKRIGLILASFKCWLERQVGGEIPELTTYFEEVQPQAELEKQVRERRKSGALLEDIADEFGISTRKVSEWCKDTKVEKETQAKITAKKRGKKKQEDAELKARASELKDRGLSLREIADELDSNHSKIRRLLLQKS